MKNITPEEIKENNTDFAVQVSTPFCGACKVLSKTLETKSEGNPSIFKMDATKHPNFARSNKITQVPTTLVYKNGNLVEKIVGSKDVYEKIIKALN